MHQQYTEQIQELQCAHQKKIQEVQQQHQRQLQQQLLQQQQAARSEREQLQQQLQEAQEALETLRLQREDVNLHKLSTCKPVLWLRLPPLLLLILHSQLQHAVIVATSSNFAVAFAYRKRQKRTSCSEPRQPSCGE